MASRQPATGGLDGPPRPARGGGRRSYLPAEQRRRQLLDVAARIAGEEGLERLSMVALAAEAGVSRQLVYEHFTDQPGLVIALLTDRFAALDEAIEQALAGATSSGIGAALVAARGFLAVGAGDRHIIRSLLAHAGAPRHELAPLGVRLRARAVGRWSRILDPGAPASRRAIVWATVNALFGLADLADAGEITLEQAIADFELLLAAAFRR